MEVRNEKGNEYTPILSLYYLACGLLRHLRDIEILEMNFLDHNDDRFARTRKVLDARMKSLVAQGIGTTTRQADPILLEQEDILWEKEVLGSSSAKSVQNTCFSTHVKCSVFVDVMNTVNLCVNCLFSTPTIREIHSVRGQTKQNLPRRTTTDAAEQ